MARARGDGVVCDAAAPERLDLYCGEVEQWAGPADLISIKDLPNLVTTHIAASLGVLWAERPKPPERWIDVGTGGGLPGMIVKVCCPEISMDLLDSSEKKILFLERVGRRLGLQEFRVLHQRVEQLAAAEGQCTYDVILMRAVTSLAKALRLIDSLSASGARFMTFKGSRWESEVGEARHVSQELGWEFVDALQIPWARPRLLRMRKKAG
ncbi:MAG: 16S rRNA (guanine(527)-N(7))-methyltransferase RsmG [Candidatus Eisenbacteria sp.]|nr:16S rRNA (guanine(527)-N(7))-methyltransferase RsmG [Candidatus Eisenbacteria bacterium]